MRGVPLLVIDDEADYASVNTKARPTDENGQPVDDYDPSKINGWIRRLLRTFEKSAYLAYTATPFANIFIDEDEETDSFGEDLFPRSFIVSLRPPSNYTGVVRVFGLDADVTAGIEADAGIPAIRTVADNEAWLPDKHKKDWIPGDLPDSLVEATSAFLLATAARRARGQFGHNSMLVHVTRFTAVQAHVQRSLSDHISLLRSRIRYGGDDSTGLTVAVSASAVGARLHPDNKGAHVQARPCDGGRPRGRMGGSPEYPPRRARRVAAADDERHV